MRPALDLVEELEGAIRDAAGAWRFIRRFAEAFATPLTAGDGCSEESLVAAEQRLGFPLPAALRQAYALVGRRVDLTRTQDRLLTPDQIHIDDTGQTLIFRVENQHVVEWGVPLSALSEPDPPVMFRESERAWQPFLERSSWACVEMVLSEWMLSGAEFADNRELDGETAALLEKRFRRLPMPEYPLWADPSGPPTRWFQGSGSVLREDAGAWLWVRTSSQDSIDAVRQALPGEWLMDVE